MTTKNVQMFLRAFGEPNCRPSFGTLLHLKDGDETLQTYIVWGHAMPGEKEYGVSITAAIAGLLLLEDIGVSGVPLDIRTCFSAFANGLKGKDARRSNHGEWLRLEELLVSFPWTIETRKAADHREFDIAAAYGKNATDGPHVARIEYPRIELAALPSFASFSRARQEQAA